jgi:SWI/SNF-related matrix-associated actin-dependent regulator 1 of chromatin subfamily A
VKIEKELPKSLMNRLYPHQLKGIEYGVIKHGRVLIGDDMGTGKTVQAISLAYIYRDEWPVLVLTTLSMKKYWRNEFLKWLPLAKNTVEVLQTPGAFVKSTAKVFIISYDSIPQLHDSLPKKSFKVTIVDEPVNLPNKDSKKMKTILHTLKQCRRVIVLLSGASSMKPVGLFCPLNILRPDIWHSFKDFGYRYCNPKPGFFDVDWTGKENMDELNLSMMNSVMIQRRRMELTSELPAVIRQKVEIELEYKQYKEATELLHKLEQAEVIGALEKELLDQSVLTNPDIKSILKLAATSKVKGIIDLVSVLLESNVKTVVVIDHEEVAAQVEEYLHKHKIIYLRLKNTMNKELIKKLCDQYNKSNTCNMLILDFLVDANITSCLALVFAELTLNQEAIKRIESAARVCTSDPLNIYYLIAEDTLDEYMHR